MDEIITSGSVAAASCPGFHVQDETMETGVNMDDELDNVEEGEEEEQAAEEMELAPGAKGRKKKCAATARPGEPHVKWTSKEDDCLAEAWKTVSIDPITGSNQNADTYWRRNKMASDERKLVDPDFANIRMDRSKKAMANHRVVIQTAYNKWHGIIEEVTAHLESGANIEG